MEHLWEVSGFNIFVEGPRQFEIESWEKFVDERTNHTNSNFMGPLLWHRWVTPANDCEECTDQEYCADCDWGERRPIDINTMWLLYAQAGGNPNHPFLYVIDVKRSDEPAILEWLKEEYGQRGLSLK